MTDAESDTDARVEALQKELAETRRQLAELAGKPQTVVRDEAIEAQAQQIAEQLEQGLTEVRDFVNKNPMSASVIAFVLGILFSRIFR